MNARSSRSGASTLRLTTRWPSIGSIVPFIPVSPLWWIVDRAARYFRAPSCRDPRRWCARSASLVYKGILPEYLQDSIVRLAVGAFCGHRARHSARAPGRPQPAAHTALWPLLLFFQAIGDIAWLPILVIWFGYGLSTMTFVIVYTVIFPVVLNTVLGVRSIPIDMHRAAL